MEWKHRAGGRQQGGKTIVNPTARSAHHLLCGHRDCGVPGGQDVARLRGYLPVGGVEQLITQPAKNPLVASEAIRAEHVDTLGQSLFWLVVAIIGADC